MKKVVFLLVGLVYVLSSTTFAQQTTTKTKTGAGALLGGLLGAAAGGVIGHDSGKTTEGVLIGGAVGALGGAAVGSQMKTTVPVEQTPQPAAPQTTVAVPVSATDKVTMKQVIYWTEQGLPAEEIIARIQKSNTIFVLTVDDIAYLQKNDVSQLVIEAMQGQ